MRVQVSRGMKGAPQSDKTEVEKRQGTGARCASGQPSWAVRGGPQLLCWSGDSAAHGRSLSWLLAMAAVLSDQVGVLVRKRMSPGSGESVGTGPSSGLARRLAVPRGPDVVMKNERGGETLAAWAPHSLEPPESLLLGTWSHHSALCAVKCTSHVFAKRCYIFKQF